MHTGNWILTPILVMERDRRLTGRIYGQMDQPIAPKGFELNSAWRVCPIALLSSGKVTNIDFTAREEGHIERF